jgi:L-asparaginase
MTHHRILLIRTGGTIDAEPYSNPHEPPKHVSTLSATHSLIEQTIDAIGAHNKIDHFRMLEQKHAQFVKDSQLFTREDMQELADIIRSNDHQHIIITHGTDAMTHNATLLKEALGATDKTVIFTGAMIPLSMSDQHKSDGIAGLEYSIAHVNQPPAGVYVTARDRHTKRLQFFAPETIEKDRMTSKKDLAFTVTEHAR